MDSRDLTTQQAQKLMDAIGPQLRYVTAVRDRMTRLGFPKSDPLLQAAHRAQDGLQHLYVAAHYASCKTGVGR